jgi:hypothetical protein
MGFDLGEARAVLARMPATLAALLTGLDDGWTGADEGPETWSPFDVVGHLIHGERTDWMQRVEIILEHGKDRAFEPFDRFAQIEASRGRSMEDLLEEFAKLRRANLEKLDALRLGPSDFERPGRHPELGAVTLGQLLATWVTHDLGHIAQIARVMAKRYGADAGPWAKYLSILRDRVDGPAS